MKLFSLPYFSNYFITKKGDIYDMANKCVYHNGNSFPMLIDDNNSLHDVRPFHALYAYCGYMKNGYIGADNQNDLSSKNLYYKIKSVKILNDNQILVNDELFTKIKDFDNYFINHYGAIYSKRMNKIIRHNMSKEYRIVNLVNDAHPTGISLYVHHLVYETYIGERPKDRYHVIDHKDSHKWNNYYLNFQVITAKENIIKDSDKISDSYNVSISSDVIEESKLYSYSDDFIENICKLLLENKSSSQICTELGITDPRSKNRMITLCYRIREHQTRPEITSKYDFSNYDTTKSKTESYQKYNDQIVDSIYRMFDAGFSNVQIGELLGIPRQTINRYRRNDTRENKSYNKNIYYEHNRDHLNKYDNHTILAIKYLATQGLGDTEIGRILDIPPNSVHMHSKKVKNTI